MTDICILYVEDEQAHVDLLQFAFNRARIANPLRVVKMASMPTSSIHQ
jgi:hypothetical protein